MATTAWLRTIRPTIEARSVRLAVALLLAAGLLATGIAPAAPAPAPTAAAAAPSVDRIWGPDRYSTSAAISAATFPSHVPVAYVATGATYPDALAGGAVGGRDGAPVLLVRRGSVPESVATELTRLAPGRIVVLGGPASVDEVVVDALRAYTTGAVDRIGGANRYEVAASLSRKSYSAGVGTVYVATGRTYADALSGAALAGRQGVPLLLVSSGVPPVVATELRRLSPSTITILGGTASVSAATESTLRTFTRSGTVSRIGGADRYVVSAKVSAAAFPSASRAFIATGVTFPDALSGASAAVSAGGPVLLARTGCVPSGVRDEITRLGATDVTLLGGPDSLSSAVASLTECGSAPGQVCTSPTRKLVGPPSSGFSTQDYYVHNNMWNTSYDLGPETLGACSYHSWFVTSKQTNHAGAVLTYPNVHKDYGSSPRLSSLSRLTSRFAAKGPEVGIYNIAYDIWLDSIADRDSTEVMIWTENHRQVPAGSKVANVTFTGITFDVWKTSDNQYIAFVPRTKTPFGTFDLLAMLRWLQGRGWVRSAATLEQVCFGVEVVHTGGTTARWDFTDFGISEA